MEINHYTDQNKSDNYGNGKFQDSCIRLHFVEKNVDLFCEKAEPRAGWSSGPPGTTDHPAPKALRAKSPTPGPEDRSPDLRGANYFEGLSARLRPGPAGARAGGLRPGAVEKTRRASRFGKPETRIESGRAGGRSPAGFKASLASHL